MNQKQGVRAYFRIAELDVSRLIIFAAGYYIAVLASDHAYGSLEVPSPFWIPDSVLLCALLLTPRKHWWAYLFAVWPIRLFAGSLPNTPFWFLVTGIANDSLKALLAAWLLQRLTSRTVRLDTARDFMIFLGVATTGVPLLSALAAAAARQRLGYHFWEAGYQWFLGNALAQVVVTPALLYWCTKRYRLANAHLKELAVISGVLISVVYYCYVIHQGPFEPIWLYAPLPLLIWAAMRTRPFGTASAILLVALIIMVSAVQGSGLFSRSVASQAVLTLRIQLFLMMTAVPLLSLSILNAERESRVQELQSVLDAAPIAILIATDPACNRVIANAAGYQMRRLPSGTNMNISLSLPLASELPFRALRDGVELRPEELPLQRAAATGVPVFGFAYTMEFKDGIERHLVGNATPLTDEDGRPRGAVGAFVDITERKLTEDALRESEERFRLVANNAPVLIWMTGPDQLCTFVSKGWLDFTGRSMEQELGSGWAAGVHPEDRERCIANYRDAFDARMPLQMEFRVRRRDGEYRWIADEGVPRFDSHGNFCGFIGACMDITERKVAEDALRESEERFRLVADTAPVLIWMSGTDKLCTFFNQGWLIFTGRSMEQELGLGWAHGVHPEDLDRCLEEYSTAFDAHQPFVMEYRLRRFDGEYRWIVDYGVPRFDSQGKFCGYIGSGIDVTDRKAAEQGLQELSGRLINAQELERARIARELHDDVGQRIALVQVGIETLEQETAKLPLNTRKQLESIAELTAQIASQLHNFSHQLHPSTLELLGFVPALRSFCREFSERHHIAVQFVHRDVPEEIPKDVSLCVYRIVQEGLRNVAKHSGVADATVDLSGQNEGLLLYLSDAGIGFDPESLAGKAGLGLVSMRERLRSIGGKLLIHSEPSRGTHISVWIPLHTGDAKHEDTTSAQKTIPFIS